MSERIQVQWQSGTPFLILVERLTALAARRWGGEPTEALGYVWERLRLRFRNGDLIDPQECHIAIIVRRKVNSFYTRSEKPPRSRIGWLSLAEVEEVADQDLMATGSGWRGHGSQSLRMMSYPTRTRPTRDEIADREISEPFEVALADLSPRQREAVGARLKLSNGRTVNELAQAWKTTRQNVHKHAHKGVEKLRASLARFA